MTVKTTSEGLLVAGCSILLLLGSSAAGSERCDAPVELAVESGVDGSGHATELWQSILRKRLTAEDFAAVADVRKTLLEEEIEWERLIRSRLSAWKDVTPGIAELYRPAPPPPLVVIVLGNRGATDAFTHDPMTMGFDLAALGEAYGNAAAPENTARIDRLFTHELAHLMQKAWMRDHPYDASTPLRAALRGIWLEGLGNYHSMSERWRATAGVPSQRAATTLAALEPRFCARLAAIACANGEGVRALTADMSQGRFDRKWGALTAALWIEQEMSVSPDAYRRLVESGPDAILELARRHLPNQLAAVIDELVMAEPLCH